jgi:hypothetical protein
MIDRSHQGAFQQLGLIGRGHLTTHHQPDHLRKSDLADQFLHRMTAQFDTAWFHVNDRG